MYDEWNRHQINDHFICTRRPLSAGMCAAGDNSRRMRVLEEFYAAVNACDNCNRVFHAYPSSMDTFFAVVVVVGL